jgi:hypothetical protein
MTYICLIRQINGIEIARRSLQLYKALVAASDHHGPPRGFSSEISVAAATAAVSEGGSTVSLSCVYHLYIRTTAIHILASF